MEKIETFQKKEKIPIKVQFEYLNDNEILVISKEYKINISLLDNADFQTNKEKILTNSNFKTEKERNVYHMFNKSSNKFLVKNSDFIPYIKNNSPIILINCYRYANEIIEKIKEEIKDTNLALEKPLPIIEIKKKEIELILSCLENNLQVDIFADEFLFKNGMEYLIIFIKNNDGNIRKYSLKSIDRLLSFQSAFDFFEKNQFLLSNLYDSFIENKDINCAYPFFDIIVKLIGGNEERTMDLVDKMDDSFYDKTINYLSEDNKEDNVKNHTLFFINMILNFSKTYKHLILLYNFTKSGVFEKFDKMCKDKELYFLEQLNLFETSVLKILNESDKDNENYKNIKEKFDVFIYNKKYYHIQNLIKATKNEDDSIKNDVLSELNNFLKENNSMNDFYEAFMKNENIDIINSFYDYLINLTESKKGIDKEKITNRFIDSAKKYAEKTSTKTFNQIINYLSKDYKDEIKIHTLLFVNKLLSFIKKDKQIEILLLFVEENIFDLLLLIKLNDNEEFANQINIFGSLIEKILDDSNKETDIYKTIKTKYELYYETKAYNDIKDLTLKIHNSVEKEQVDYTNELVKLVNEKKAYEILYNTFMDNNNNNIAFSYFDIFVRIFGADQKHIMLLIDIAKKYSEKNNCKMFNKFIEYTSDKNTNDFVKGQSMQILNMIINFSESDKQYELLVLYEEMGFFENLNNLIKNKDTHVMAQMKLFLSFVKQLLKSRKVKDEKYNTINKKYKKVLEDKKFYDKTVDDFVVVDDFDFEK